MEHSKFTMTTDAHSSNFTIKDQFTSYYDSAKKELSCCVALEEICQVWEDNS